jgi:hypothetical protein
LNKFITQALENTSPSRYDKKPFQQTRVGAAHNMIQYTRGAAQWVN